MGFRFYDWECTECHRVFGDLVFVPQGEEPPKTQVADCTVCGQSTVYERRISAPAPYMGEKVHNPLIRGGRFDTMGCETVPRLKPMPGVAEYDRKCAEAFATLPPDVPPLHRNNEIAKIVGEPPALGDVVAHAKTSENREIAAERRRVIERNNQKKARAAALASGANINMRRDKCAGDPKI